MIIKAQDVPEIKVEGQPLTVKRIVSRDQHSEDISVTWVQVVGHHNRVVSDVTDRVYYIVEGEGEFQVADQPPGKVAAGDYVFIPKGTPYELDGHMTYLVMMGPAFAPGSDRVLE
jgi:mannose-6-phosphate isomerase-like protein (cupin superfamily)